MNNNFNCSFIDSGIKGYDETNNIDFSRKFISAIMWKNDKIFLQIALLSTFNINDIIVSAKNNDNIFSKFYLLSKVKAFVGHAGWYAQNPKNFMPTGPKVETGDPLVAIEKLSLEKDEITCIFVEINTFDNSKSGNQIVEISLDNEMINEKLKIDLSVLNLKMTSAEKYNFKVEYWHHPYNISEYYEVPAFSQKHLDILTEHQNFYKNIGGYGVVASIVEEAWGGQTYSKNNIHYPSMIKWIKEKGKFRFDYTDFDKWVKLNIDLGLGDKIICYSLMAWGNKLMYYDINKNRVIKKTVSPIIFYKYKKCWKRFLDDFIAHLDCKGWFENIYLGFDERSNMKKVLDFALSFKNKDNKSFKVSASFNNFIGNKQCFDMLDYASIGLDEIRNNKEVFKKVAKIREEQGKDTSLYTATEHYPNSFALSLPVESYWSVMFAYFSGANGFLRWALDAWVSNPLEDTTHCSFQAGDCFLIYPSEKNSGKYLSQWSIRLVKLDEAVRDVNKLIEISKIESFKSKVVSLGRLIKDNYSYNLLQNKSWGVSIREAKWADENAKNELVNDVNILKQEINQLFIAYEKHLCSKV